MAKIGINNGGSRRVTVNKPGTAGSVTVNAGPALPTLDTPTGVNVAVISASQLNVTWNTVANATNYVLERSTDNSNWTQVYSGATASFNNTGLSASTLYYYRVKAQAAGYNDSGYGVASGTTSTADYSTFNAPIITGASTSTDGSYIDVYFDRQISVDANSYNKFSYFKNGVFGSFTASVIKPDNNKAIRLSVSPNIAATDVVRVSHSGLLTTPNNEYSYATYKVPVGNCVGRSKPTSYDKFTFIADFSNSNNLSVNGSNVILQLNDISKANGVAVREADNTRPTYNAASKKAVFSSPNALSIWDDLLLLGHFTFAFRISKANTTAQNILVQSAGLGNLFTGVEGSTWFVRFSGPLALNTDFTRTGDELATGTVYNCILRYNGATYQLYVDGALYMSKAVTSNSGFNIHQIGPIDADYYWLGVANEALTDTEISELNTFMSSL